MDDMKVCSRCGESQPLTEFYFDRSWGRLKGQCRGCERRRAKERYDPDKARAKYMARKDYYNRKSRKRAEAVRVTQKPELPDRPILARPCLRCGNAHTRRSFCCSKTCTSALYPRDWRHKNSRRRTKMAETDLSATLIRKLVAARTYCPVCKKRMGKTGPHAKHLDHVIPLAAGGTHTLDNVRVICATCNMARPFDGSDLGAYQTTIWSEDPRLVLAVRPPRVKRLPSPRARMMKLRREGLRECRRLESQLAYVFRLNGAQWAVIADRFGFASASGAYNFVHPPRLRA